MYSGRHIDNAAYGRNGCISDTGLASLWLLQGEVCLFAGAYKRFWLFAVKAVDEIIYRRFSVQNRRQWLYVIHKDKRATPVGYSEGWYIEWELLTQKTY